jgi:hypothetical protein
VGLLTNKTALPVTELHIGGMAGSHQAVQFELGSLVCAGQEVCVAVLCHITLGVLVNTQ